MIPSKEQFIELNSALIKSVEFIENRLDYTRPYREHPELPEIHTILNYTNYQKLTETLTAEKLQDFIKPDIDLYLEQLEGCQNLPACRWLHGQQNFIKARARIFNRHQTEERLSNDLAEYISKSALDYFEREMKEKELLVSSGVTFEETKNSTIEERLAVRLANSLPHEIMQSALHNAARGVVRYSKWVAGVSLALSNYHYGEMAEMTVNRKHKVESLIAAWGAFNEQVRLAQTDTELGEYLNNSVLRIIDDRKLIMLRAIHQNGAFYFIGRKDEKVSDRLFIKEMALLHKILFYKLPTTSVITDLFYLDGMKSAPTERTIQRITKSAIANWREIGKVESNAIDLWRQKK